MDDLALNPSAKKWDPTGIIQESQIDAWIAEDDESKKNVEKLAIYKKRPYLLRYYFIGSFLPVLLLICLDIILKASGNSNIVNTYAYIIAYPFLVAVLAPALYYMVYVKPLQNELINVLIAEEQGWAYVAKESNSRWQELKKIFPLIFDRGNRLQTISDQFWGTYLGRQFWIGKFNFYETGGKGRFSSKYVYIFPLNCLVPYDFTLRTKGFYTLLEPGKEENIVATESPDFNERYEVSFQGDRGMHGASVFQGLNPLVQEKLVTFYNTCGIMDIIFQDTTMIAVSDYFFEGGHTNFLRSVVLDSRDTAGLIKRLEQIARLGEEVAQVL